MAEIKQTPITEVKHEVKKEVVVEVPPATIVSSTDKSPVRIIKNAKGVEVPIYAEGPDEFIENANTFSDAKLAYENIELSIDDSVEKVFKFNEDVGMGWLTFYDMNNKVEIKNKGTVHKIEQIYPFIIDKDHSIVSTVLEETYPMILTDELPSQEVKEEYERLRRIESAAAEEVEEE